MCWENNFNKILDGHIPSDLLDSYAMKRSSLLSAFS